ncbi:helix-turn-helix domain-containing protein [Streptomyces sp. NPDC017529]|uniref:helix-turn-helix domain-containing protein n=1 Tax=Streptomyces sp. NPDC017529 TaxID=3365000 RepID=UPI00379B38F5
MRNTRPDFESLHDKAATLRRAGPSRHPNAKGDARARARELRARGMTYDEIVAELGVSKSSVSLWVRDLPKPAASPERMHRMREARWEPHRKAVAEARRRTKEDAAREIGALTERELFLIGVGLYWAEGSKSKPHSPQERATFINSDPGMIQVYLAWLALLGVTPERTQFRVHIHESAGVAAAERYWADLVGIDVTGLARTTLKKHNPKTVRKNVGEDYHGCLVVRVLQSADLYRRIEGWWYGIVLGAKRPA